MAPLPPAVTDTPNPLVLAPCAGAGERKQSWTLAGGGALYIAGAGGALCLNPASSDPDRIPTADACDPRLPADAAHAFALVDSQLVYCWVGSM